ncbi:MAG: TerB family tellurite resistance protein [Deltaproteobacteria bacterium]|nr:TerB family tellurite resistance protein [Deltaproteobacteria bacterium]
MSWFNLLGIKEDKNDLGELYNFISGLTSDHGDEYAKFITGYAGILGRVAYADNVITDEELKEIESVLLLKSKLSKDETASIIELITKHKVEILTIEEHFYTRMINEVCTKDKKLDLIKNMFEIAAADNTICTLEENLIYQTATAINISKKELTEIKREFSKYLGTLK